MPKIIEEAEQIGTITLDDGRVVPHMKCKSETLIINTKTGHEYSSEEEVKNDINNPETETKEEHIRRDVKIFAPSLRDMLGEAAE
jgi:hypothetical protein